MTRREWGEYAVTLPAVVAVALVVEFLIGASPLVGMFRGWGWSLVLWSCTGAGCPA